MNPYIRHLERADVPIIVDLGRNVPEFTVDNKHSFWPIDTLDRFVEEGLSFVVEERANTQIVGFLLAAYQPVTRKLTVEDVYISPNYRRKFLADACFHQSWSIAKYRGAVMAEALVKIENSPSRKMFERLGFQNVGTYSWMLQFSS